jgi:hypothetical protein
MDFQTALNRFIELNQSHINDYFAKHYQNLTPPTFSVEPGSVYVKIVRTDSQRSVHCFVKKEDGTIWKAASWKAPAKNFPRGNIYVDNPRIETYGY